MSSLKLGGRYELVLCVAKSVIKRRPPRHIAVQYVEFVVVAQYIVIVVVLRKAGILMQDDIRITSVYLALSVIRDQVMVVCSDVR